MYLEANSKSLIARNATVVPAVCYATCNNCYMDAQSTGLNSALCASGSTFETEYAKCEACVQENSGSSSTSLSTYVDPEFAPFIEFCNALSASPSQASSIYSVYYATVTQNNTVYVTLPAAPTDTSLASNATASSHRNYAWIAGLLVGVIAVVTAIASSLLYIRKRRKTKESAAMTVQVDSDDKGVDTLYKAQLHSDSIVTPRYELGTGLETKDTPELPALEAVGSELQGDGFHGKANVPR